MAITKLTIQEFLELSLLHPVIDVRSPGEYTHAHIPGAYTLPLFSDEERKIVGTIYKKQTREAAIKTGLNFFGVKMSSMISEVEKIVQQESKLASDKTKGGNGSLREKPASRTLLVHCWRGGMRSAGVAWLLDLYGFSVFTLTGGYKAYRNWVLQQFEKDYQVNILGGYTGSGKTDLLKVLAKNGHQIIDLEELANHKGSAFGALGKSHQPTQEMFENLLANKLSKIGDRACWVEDESQRIGILNIPNHFWKFLRTKPVFFIDIPFSQRLAFITKEYGLHEKEKLKESVLRIQKRLGPLETKTAIGFLNEDNYVACFDILLHYYDKLYKKGLYNRENIDGLLNKIPCSSVDAISNNEKLLACTTVNI